MAGGLNGQRPNRRVIVIGAGTGGLATALRLLGHDFDVTVLEARSEIGGRAGRLAAGGFTFDRGPAVLFMPWVLEELFQVAGARMADRLRLLRLDPFYRVHWHAEERTMAVSADRGPMVDEIARFSAEDAERYDAFLAAGRTLYERAGTAGEERAAAKGSALFALGPALAPLGGWRSVEAFLRRFFREPHVRQALGVHQLLVGNDVYRTPAILASLVYAQLDQGLWHVEGGMHSLVGELARLCRSGGATVVAGRRVTSILTSGDRAHGVRTDHGEEIRADFIVSAADPLTTQVELLGRALPAGRPSMSLFQLLFGTDRDFPQLDHLTVLLDPDHREFVTDVTRRLRMPAGLSLHVVSPTRTDPGMAPPGGAAMVVNVPMPNLGADIEWDLVADELRERVIAELESAAGLGLTGLRDSVQVEAAWTPLDFRNLLGTWDGAAYGLEPTIRPATQLRSAYRDRRLRGMFYAGSGVQPGQGLPGALLGAEMAASMIAREARDRPDGLATGRGPEPAPGRGRA